MIVRNGRDRNSGQAAQHRQPETLELWRVRWRGDWWEPTSVTPVRLYQSEQWARWRVRRLQAAGYLVELSKATRTPWRHDAGSDELRSHGRWWKEAG